MNKQYKWVICAVCFLIMFLSFGLAYTSISLYMAPICDAYGFLRGQFTVVISLVGLTMSAGALLFAPLAKRLSFKGTLIIGVVLSALGLFVMSLAQHLVLFYLCGLLIGLGLGLSTNIPVNLMLLNWFGEKRGSVVGLVLSATGFGSMLFSPIIAAIIQNQSYELALRLSAGLLLLIVPLGLWGIRERPTQAEQISKTEEIAQYEESNSDLTMKAVKKSSSFYLCIATFAIFSIIFVGVTYFAPSYLVDIGLSTAVAGILIGVLNACNAIGKIVMGKVNDILGVNACVIYGIVLFVLSMLVALNAKTLPLAILFTVLYGFSVPTASFPITIIVSRLFGQKAYGQTLSLIQASSGLASALATPLAGFLFDSVQDFTIIFILYIVISIFPLITYQLALRKKPLMVQ